MLKFFIYIIVIYRVCLVVIVKILVYLSKYGALQVVTNYQIFSFQSVFYGEVNKGEKLLVKFDSSV
jgi:hypothetical protein